MSREDCQKYLENPEANAAHLAGCASCRAVAEELSRMPERARIEVGTLPLAPWEGAGHRSWPLVVGGVLALAAVALAFFAASGTSPLSVMEDVPSVDVLMSMFRLAGGAAQNAPLAWQVGIGISFLLVNALLIALLRRAPKGIDV
jgi:hypothetical protein